MNHKIGLNTEITIAKLSLICFGATADLKSVLMEVSAPTELLLLRKEDFYQGLQHLENNTLNFKNLRVIFEFFVAADEFSAFKQSQIRQVFKKRFKKALLIRGDILDSDTFTLVFKKKNSRKKIASGKYRQLPAPLSRANSSNYRSLSKKRNQNSNQDQGILRGKIVIPEYKNRAKIERSYEQSFSVEEDTTNNSSSHKINLNLGQNPTLVKQSKNIKNPVSSLETSTINIFPRNSGESVYDRSKPSHSAEEFEAKFGKLKINPFPYNKSIKDRVEGVGLNKNNPNSPINRIFMSHIDKVKKFPSPAAIYGLNSASCLTVRQPKMTPPYQEYNTNSEGEFEGNSEDWNENIANYSSGRGSSRYRNSPVDLGIKKGNSHIQNNKQKKSNIFLTEKSMKKYLPDTEILKTTRNDKEKNSQRNVMSVTPKEKDSGHPLTQHMERIIKYEKHSKILNQRLSKGRISPLSIAKFNHTLNGIPGLKDHEALGLTNSKLTDKIYKARRKKNEGTKPQQSSHNFHKSGRPSPPIKYNNPNNKTIRVKRAIGGSHGLFEENTGAGIGGGGVESDFSQQRKSMNVDQYAYARGGELIKPKSNHNIGNGNSSKGNRSQSKLINQQSKIVQYTNS